MKTILFIYNNPLDGSYGGSQRTKNALSGLKQNFNVITYSCIKKRNKVFTLIRNVFGYSGSLSWLDCKKVINLIKKNQIEAIFFDVSLHGRLVKDIKKRYPHIKIIVNYHNCEAKYCGDMYKAKGKLYYPVFKAAMTNEKLSIQYADFHILITEEDRQQLGINENYCVIPVTLQDSFVIQNNKKKESYLLFVGAAQYANIEGAKFIIEKIAPKIEKKVLIIGKGMKSVFSGVYKNVEVRDFAESLTDVFQNATAFISPLFSGSGAKVKIAEALMYGKKIIGTSLSFFGYDLTDANYVVCNSEVDFIEVINKVDMNKCFYPENRELFLKKYSADNNKMYYSIINKLF